MEVTGGIDCGGCGDGSSGGDEGSVESTAGADEEAAAAAWQQSGRDPTCDDTRVVLRRCGRAVARAAWAHRPQVISVCATGAIRRAMAMVGTQAHLLRRSCEPDACGMALAGHVHHRLACHSSARCQRAAR